MRSKAWVLTVLLAALFAAPFGLWHYGFPDEFDPAGVFRFLRGWWMAVAAGLLVVYLAAMAWWFYGARWRDWRGWRDALRGRLVTAGLLPPDAPDDADAFVRITPVTVPAWYRWWGEGGRYALVWREGRALRFLGDEPFVADAYRIEPGCGADCHRCAVSWACGGRAFRLWLWVNGREVTVWARAFGGRDAAGAARAQNAFYALLTVGEGMD